MQPYYEEYFQFAKQRLAPDGMFVQWISLSTLAGDFKIILRTLMDEFEHVETFTLLPNSALMVASQKPIFGRPLRSSQEMTRAFVDLQPFGMDSRDALLAKWVAGKPQLWDAVANAPVSRWDHLIMDYTPFMANEFDWKHAERDNLRLLVTAGERSRNDLSLDMAFRRSSYGQSNILAREAYLAILSDNKEAALSLITQARQANPMDQSVEQIYRFINAQKP